MLIADYKFNNENDLLPVFNENFQYTNYEDTTEDNITHRLIYADSLPESISFADNSNLIECGYLALDNVTSFGEAFFNCINLQLIDGSRWNVSNVTSFDMTFCYCSSLTDILGIQNWETPNLGKDNTNRALVATFGFCQLLKIIDLSNWEINYPVSGNSTFTSCTSVTEIFLPKKIQTINILAMFQNCQSLVKIHGLERITSLDSSSNRRTFENCYALKEVIMPNLDASAASRLDTMFSNCKSLEVIDLSHAKINDNCVVTTFFTNCESLKSIKINADNLAIIKKLITQLPANTSGSFSIIGAEDIMAELEGLIDTTNWTVVPFGRKTSKIKTNKTSSLYMLNGNKRIKCKLFGILKFKE